MRFSGPKLVCVIIVLSAVICTLTIPKAPYDRLKHFVNNKVSARLLNQRPCACPERCLAAMKDEWLKERFRKDIPPVLSLNNSDLSEEINTWWQVRASANIHCRFL